MLKEFQAFALRGNVIDLAIGVIIGAAFGKIVDSAVNDLIMPIVAAFLGHLDFSNLFIVLGPAPADMAMTLDAMKKAGVPVFAYGNFITVAVNFLILAVIIFLMIRQINKLKGDSTPKAVAPKEEVLLLRDIRDSLKK
jgi:large conductance mechanosensitive channel